MYTPLKMISNKTVAILLFSILNMQHAASTSPRGTKRRRSSGMPALPVKKRGPARKPSEVLQDTNSGMDPVEVQRGSAEVISTSQGLSVPQVDNQFKTFIKKGKYWKIFELGKKMNDEGFLKQLCPIVETPDQYNGIVGYLKDHKMVASFYVHGNIRVVKRAIVESRVYGGHVYYVDGGDLETALPLALEKDRYDRVIKLLDFRKGITAVMDEQRELDGSETSFGWFVYTFLSNLAPWKDGMALRRFLILLGDELRNKYGDIFDTFCRELVNLLSFKLDLPKAKGLLLDLIGQPSLLTPAAFARGFLSWDNDEIRSAFIKYGWRETIQEGLKSEYPGGGEELWRVMQKEKPGQFSGEFQVTEEASAAVCMYFSTKQEKEEQWADENVKILYNKLRHHEYISYLFPDVLLFIIASYAISWTDTDDSTIPSK